MRTFLTLLLALVMASTVTAVSHAQPMGRGMYQGAPYGHFCPGRRWGPYGVRNPVRTVEEARQVVELYLSGNTEGTRVGKIEENKGYFTVEILDKDNTIIDTVIVAKRSGRIRSIY